MQETTNTMASAEARIKSLDRALKSESRDAKDKRARGDATHVDDAKNAAREEDVKAEIEKRRARKKRGGKNLSDAHLSPIMVTSLRGEEVRMVTMGSSHAMATTDGGDVYVWGRGATGQLGTGLFNDIDAPSLIGGEMELQTVAELFAGNSHSAGITTKGELYTWGMGGEGKLGNVRSGPAFVGRDIARRVRHACRNCRGCRVEPFSQFAVTSTRRAPSVAPVHRRRWRCSSRRHYLSQSDRVGD